MISDEARLSGLWCESDFTDRLLDTAHVAVLFMDREGRIELFNPYMRDLCGYELDEVRGKDWFEVFIEEHERARLRELYRSAIDELQVRANVNAIVTKSGELRQLEWWGNTVHDEHGELLGLLSVGQDITDLVELKRKLAESERLASIGMMASVFAHEVGNPLNGMFLQAQLLRRRIDNPNRGELAPNVDAILDEIRRLNMLLEDFRAFHQPGKLTLEVTDLGHVLRAVTEMLAERAAERDIELHCEIPDTLPNIAANANKLKQVFINLCKNGLEAMPKGGTLAVRTRIEDERVCVEVEDQGVGLPADVDVFAPFSSTKPSGMGLGLPLVREIIAAHGGEVSCVSQPQRGTTFTVKLPCRGASETS